LTALFEFLIGRRPLSLQTKNRENLQQWKTFVKSEAAKNWHLPLIAEKYLHISIVYLCDDSPPDADNIVKPILDALVGLIYNDDEQVADVESHRRYLSEGIDATNLPLLLQHGVLKGEECVYVKIEDSLSLETYLL
jgi:hypothetical protein